MLAALVVLSSSVQRNRADPPDGKDERSRVPMSPAPTPLSAPLAPASRLQGGPSFVDRALRIQAKLDQGRPFTAPSLAREVSVSSRTIKRAIEWLRAHGAVITWEPTTRTYFSEHPCPQLPLLRLATDEALALVLAGRTFAAWHGSPLGKALTTAFGKIANVVGPAVTLPLTEFRDFIFLPDAGPAAETEQRFFPAALTAIQRRQVVRLAYRKAEARRATSRLVHPLHLAHLDHRWVLIAHDPVHGAPRNFLLQRIRGLDPTGAHFTRPPGFDLHAYLRGSLGRFTGGGDHEVRLVFDATVAPYVRENPWHPSQAMRARPGGAIEVTLRLNNLIDVQRRVLACGAHVEVLAPPALRAAIRTAAAALAARHADDIPGAVGRQPPRERKSSPPGRSVSHPVC